MILEMDAEGGKERGFDGGKVAIRFRRQSTVWNASEMIARTGMRRRLLDHGSFDFGGGMTSNSYLEA